MGNPIQSDQEEQADYIMTMVLIGAVVLLGIVVAYVYFQKKDLQESPSFQGSGVKTQIGIHESIDNAFYEAKSINDVLSERMRGTVEYWLGDILWHQKKYQEA